MKKFISLLTSLVIILNSINIQATEQINLETMDELQRQSTIGNIVNCVAFNKTDYLNKNSELFTEHAFSKYINYAEEAEINCDSVDTLIVDTIFPNKSTTGDTVIMANAKVVYEDSGVNTLYLFEFHVNKDGKIYGYNVWAY